MAEEIKKKCIVCGETKPLYDMQKKKGGKYGTSNVCNSCHADYMKKYRKIRAKALTSNESDERHGTYYGYVLGCRCDRCKEAVRNYMRGYRKGKNGN